MPSKQKYPNLPDDFPDLVRARREELGISMSKMSLDNGWVISKVHQLENRLRNFNYETAQACVRYLDMDYELPEPDLTNREPLRRDRGKLPIRREPFFVEIDGEIIQVLTYRRHGPVKKAKIYNPEEQEHATG